jgi:sugar phosphate isomerase/epimerase
MPKMKGPAVFLAQFLADEPPRNTLEDIATWFKGLGYRGLQIPTDDPRVFKLDRAAESKTYCDEYKGKLKAIGVEVSELAAYLAGQVLAIHPVYQRLFESFFPQGLSGAARAEWAQNQLRRVIRASVNFGTTVIPTLSGGFAWHLVYPWPQRPDGIIDEAFTELAKRWRPLLDEAHEYGIVFTYELHPGSDIFDGATYEMFLDKVHNHPAACINYDASHFLLQQLDYLDFIRLYGERIRGFHVKDAEFRPDGRVGVYGGYQSWAKRAGRFRSPGDGQVDFKQVFTLLAEAGYNGWAVLEWECAVKSPEQGAKEGAPFIERHIIDTTTVAFDDFVGSATSRERNRNILGFDS